MIKMDFLVRLVPQNIDGAIFILQSKSKNTIFGPNNFHFRNRESNKIVAVSSFCTLCSQGFREDFSIGLDWIQGLVQKLVQHYSLARINPSRGFQYIWHQKVTTETCVPQIVATGLVLALVVALVSGQNCPNGDPYFPDAGTVDVNGCTVGYCSKVSSNGPIGPVLWYAVPETMCFSRFVQPDLTPPTAPE